MRLRTGVYGHHKRVCTENQLWEKNPLLHQGIEHVSATCTVISVTFTKLCLQFNLPWKNKNIELQKKLIIFCSVHASVPLAWSKSESYRRPAIGPYRLTISSFWDDNALKFQTMYSVMSVKKKKKVQKNPLAVNSPAYFSDCSIHHSPAVLQLGAFGNCVRRVLNLSKNEIDAQGEQHAHFWLGAMKDECEICITAWVRQTPQNSA